MSKGQRLKFQFAFALSHNPKLLILDEPTANFDPEFREEFFNVISEFVQDGMHSVILATHLTQDLDKIADYVTVATMVDVREEEQLLHTGLGNVDAVVVAIANDTENCLWISIHQNYFQDSQYRGAQVFYGNNPNGAILAKQLQVNFRKYLDPDNNRKEKKSKGVYVMEQIQCPAILIECGFLSNPPEERLLRTDTYQQKVCCVIAANISCYIHNDLTANRMVDIIK